MRGFAVTYERYLPHVGDEEVCEADEMGFVIENVSLRDAIRLGLEYTRPSWAGPCEPDRYPATNVRSLTFYQWNEDSRERIEEGIHEVRALHIPDNVTDASRKRICRLLGS